MAKTLWSETRRQNAAVFHYTAGSDHPWDARLLRWDVLGSLGHVEGLAASRLLRPTEHRRLRSALRAALKAVDSGRLRLKPRDEDVHTAIENWITRNHGPIGESLHTGRSRNDQVGCDLRLYLKDRLLTLHAAGQELVANLLGFARRERNSIWPGYTHTRRAMPSSAALWAGAFAEGLLDTLEELPALWTRVDRSPLGSAAGFGVPLPLRREAAARALGFAGVDHLVTTPQASRGKLEAAAVFWCAQLGHDLARLAADAILYSTEEFGYLQLPPEATTGSSIMPHKRNPDLFELTRGRIAAVDGDLAAILSLRSKLGGGYHRDYQLLKEPLMRGLDRTGEMLLMMGAVVPGLRVNRARAREAIAGDTLSTDEVMRRVERGDRFRHAYREVAAAVRRGELFPPPTVAQLKARRMSTGSLGNPGLATLERRLRRVAGWERRNRTAFDRAIRRLAGKTSR
jgi:argininosuccinate lyase